MHSCFLCNTICMRVTESQVSTLFISDQKLLPVNSPLLLGSPYAPPPPHQISPGNAPVVYGVAHQLTYISVCKSPSEADAVTFNVHG